MSTLSETATLAEVETLVQTGELFTALTWAQARTATPLLQTVIDLHNAGRIDLFALPDQPVFGQIEGRQTFVVQDFLTRAIPQLDGSVAAMMGLVAALVAKAGQDMTAGAANGGFISWCQSDLARAREVVALARASDPQGKGFLYLALQALNDLSEARAVIADFEDERRDGALLALGALAHTSDADRQATLATLSMVLTDAPGDVTRARVLEAAIRVHGSTAAPLPTPALRIIADAVAPGGDQTLHVAARLLFGLAMDRSPALTADLIAPLLEALKGVNPDHGGTLETLDVALSSLMEAGFADDAVAFVGDLLPAAAGRIALSQLEGFRNALWNRPAADFHAAIVAWWLSGDHALSEGLEVGFRHARPPQILDMALGPMALTPGQTESLCRKAIGYGFLQPVTTASVLVSAIRSADPALSKIIEDLLFDPLLTSYGGDLVDHLKSIPKTDAAYPAVQRVLRRKTRYLKGLGDAGVIKELHPAEDRRQAERIRWQDEMQRAAEKARQQSPLLSVIHRSVLLYGRQSLTLIQDPGGGDLRPVETVLHSHGVSMEMPRLQVLDPLGLDLMLLILRSEPVQS